VTDATPARLQGLIAATFDAQGWEYDLSVGQKLVEAVKEQGGVDGARLARVLPATFFDRQRVSRDLVAGVLERALSGITLREEARMPTTIVIGGNNYQVNVGEGASIINSNLNLGEGAQIIATAEADKQDVLVAVEALVRAGLADDWNDEAAKALATLVDGRSDIDYEDVQKVSSEVVKAEQPTKERLRSFLTRIAASGLAGALATGITTGIGEAITHLPL
jgi:hypothetical protein